MGTIFFLAVGANFNIVKNIYALEPITVRTDADNGHAKVSLCFVHNYIDEINKNFDVRHCRC